MQKPLSNGDSLDALFRSLIRLAERIELQEAEMARVMEFLKQNFPADFAGDADTIIDPKLNAIEIIYGEGTYAKEAQ